MLLGEIMVLGLLGKVLYANPDKAWLDTLTQEDLFAELPLAEQQPYAIEGAALLHTWAQAQQDSPANTTLDSLKADHTRLFVGFGSMPVPPWESVYFSEERLVFQERTLAVRRWYARFGMAAEKQGSEPDDHIALELTFVARLAELTLQAIQQGDEHRAQQLHDAKLGFLSEHLLQWGDKWAELAAANANTTCYRGLALILRGVLAQLAQSYALPLPTDTRYAGLRSENYQ